MTPSSFTSQNIGRCDVSSGMKVMYGCHLDFLFNPFSYINAIIRPWT